MKLVSSRSSFVSAQIWIVKLALAGLAAAWCRHLVDVVEPVDQVEEGEGDGEDHTGPLVDGVDVGQVGDLDLELRGPPP